MDRLVLVHAQQSLSAVVCRMGLRACEILHTATVEWNGGGDDALAASVSELRRLCRSAGHAGVWAGTVFVCLAPDMALFHDRKTPSTSVSVVKKSVSVMLEADFPCDTTELQHRITITSRERGKGAHSISTSVRSDVLRAWHAALKQNDVADCRITTAPWPILAGLPPLKEQALLLYVKEGRCVAVALDNRGKPRRICPLGFQAPPAAEETIEGTGSVETPLPNEQRQNNEASIAASIRRECALVFGGLDCHPRQLLLFGDTVASGGLAHRLGESFELPVALLGRDLPLARHHARIGETDSNRLLAICLLTSTLHPLSPLRPPLFSTRLQQRPLSGMVTRFWPLAAGLTCLVASWMTSVGIEGFNKLDQAERLQANMLGELRKAMPDAPRNASLMKLRTILRSRMAEQGAGAASTSGRTILGFLQLLHAQVPPDARIHIGRLSYDAGIFRLVGTASKYEELTTLRDALLGQDGIADVQLVNAAYRGTSGNTASDARTAPQNGNVDFEMSVTWDR